MVEHNQDLFKLAEIEHPFVNNKYAMSIVPLNDISANDLTIGVIKAKVNNLNILKKKATAIEVEFIAHVKVFNALISNDKYFIRLYLNAEESYITLIENYYTLKKLYIPSLHLVSDKKELELVKIKAIFVKKPNKSKP